MGLFKRITKPFKKAAEVITKPFAKITNKLLPNELRFLAPYAAGIGTLMLPPGMGPLMRTLSAAGLNTAGQIASDESATGDIDDLNKLSMVLSGGLGYLGADAVTQGGESGMGIRGGVERAGGMNPAEAAARFGEGTPQALEAAGSGGDLGFLQGAENVGREGVASLSDFVQGNRQTLSDVGNNPGSVFSSVNKFKGARDVGKALGATTTLGTGDVAYEAAIDAQDAYERADLEEQRQIDETTTADQEERATLQMKFMRQAGVPENDVETTLIMNDLGDYYEPPVEAAANGGIIGLKEGGMLNFGGREMDLRTGGFVPIGRKERADDVPARLSKNEFVMTADAVKAAGGGSVNEGAKRMYEVMNNLEARA